MCSYSIIYSITPYHYQSGTPFSDGTPPEIKSQPLKSVSKVTTKRVFTLLYFSSEQPNPFACPVAVFGVHPFRPSASIFITYLKPHIPSRPNSPSHHQPERRTPATIRLAAACQFGCHHSFSILLHDGKQPVVVVFSSVWSRSISAVGSLRQARVTFSQQSHPISLHRYVIHTEWRMSTSTLMLDHSNICFGHGC